MAANWRVMQYFRHQNSSFLLYQTNDFFILKNEQAPIIIENVGQVGLLTTNDTVFFFLKYFEE
jgi:hypothetical protein